MGGITVCLCNVDHFFPLKGTPKGIFLFHISVRNISMAQWPVNNGSGDREMSDTVSKINM